MGSKVIRLAILGAVSAAVLMVTAAAGASAAPPKRGTIVQRPVRSAAPDANLVKEYFVRVYSPLPAADGPHPTRCDWISYLRYRGAAGPKNPSKADSVFVIIPGFLGGAGSFDEVARNTVRDAAERGRQVEFWAI